MGILHWAPQETGRAIEKSVSNERCCTVTQKSLKWEEQELSAGGKRLYPHSSEVVVYVPDIPTECVGGPLQRPGEQGQLAPKSAFLEAQARRRPRGGSP